jgi:proliferating cell nuclear antigen
MLTCNKNYVNKLLFKLIDVIDEDGDITIPPLEFQSMFTIPSADFQKLCRDMSKLSDKVEFKSIGKMIVASCNGSFADQELTYGEKKEGTK